MPIARLIESIRQKVDDPSYPEIAEWKASHPGGKAIGCFPVYIPAELIHAAGMLPVQIAGAMGNVKLDEADGYLQSSVCSVGRSTLELKIDGHFSGLDGMIFPSVCEISRGLSGVLKRYDPDFPVIYIHYPQNLKSAYAKDYLVNELNRLKSVLENLSGNKITDEALLDAFKLYNERSELLSELAQFQLDHPERLSASESYLLRLAGVVVPAERHNAIIEEALKLLKDSGDRHPVRLRMVLTGAFCERPPVEMLETIEAEGVAIIHDDILLGQRWWVEKLPLEGDLISILAENYLHNTVINPVVFQPESTPCNHTLDIVERTKADGVIIASAKSCHPAHHDSHCIVRICEEHGFPFVRLEFEEDQRVFESTRVLFEALLEARERLPIAGTDKGNNVVGST